MSHIIKTVSTTPIMTFDDWKTTEPDDWPDDNDTALDVMRENRVFGDDSPGGVDVGAMKEIDVEFERLAEEKGINPDDIRNGAEIGTMGPW